MTGLLAAVSDGVVTVMNTTFYGNDANNNGGGLAIKNTDSCMLKNNTAALTTNLIST